MKTYWQELYGNRAVEISMQLKIQERVPKEKKYKLVQKENNQQYLQLRH